MTRYGIEIPIPEDIITSIGEDEAWTMARRGADRSAARHRTDLHCTDERDYRENFPRTDPETGDELPPIRLYRFTYEADA